MFNATYIAHCLPIPKVLRQPYNLEILVKRIHNADIICLSLKMTFSLLSRLEFSSTEYIEIGSSLLYFYVY